MEQVFSKDGTAIAYECSGLAGGPPLVLVHGASADHTRWAPVLPILEPTFRVVAVDRRGRGGSGDSEPYALAREFEDLRAVIEAQGAAAFVLGHSYGGLCALGAALQTARVRRLILYEPPIPTGTSGRRSPEVVAKLQRLIAAGDRDAAVVTFSREVAGISEAELALMRAAPAAWDSRKAAIHTVLREMQTVGGEALDLRPFKTLSVPTLLLRGSDSAPHLHEGVRALLATLPQAEEAALAGQQHVAINTAPERFAAEVIRFLTAQ
jgi:pimeloyl-ACP methyl ester carboxylesterase